MLQPSENAAGGAIPKFSAPVLLVLLGQLQL